MGGGYCWCLGPFVHLFQSPGSYKSISHFFPCTFFSLFQRQAINPLYSITRFIHYCGGFCGFIWSSVSVKAFLHSSSVVNRWTFFFLYFFQNTTLSPLQVKSISPVYCPTWESWRLHGGCVAIIFRHWTSFRRPLSALSQTFSFQSKVDQVQRKVQSIRFTFSFLTFLPQFTANDQHYNSWNQRLFKQKKAIT